MSHRYRHYENSEEALSDLAQINIVPLVDVILVLLVVFMLTAPLSIQGINVNLPQSAEKKGNIDNKRVILTIDKSGKFFFDHLEVKANVLGERLKAVFAVRANKSLYLRADQSVSHGRVTQAMGIAKQAGVGRIAILTSSS